MKIECYTTSYMEPLVRKMLLHAGIEIGGNKPGDITVHNPRFYSRIVKNGTLGIGESYMDGDWDSNDLTETAAKAFKANLRRSLASFSLKDAMHVARAYLTNLQTKRRSYDVGTEHYDVGNELYKAMLDARMTYTCGYWRDGAKNLDEAQEAKLDLICRKIGLKKGDTVLDIGSGFGSFLIYAAEKYGAIGTGVTASRASKQAPRLKEARIFRSISTSKTTANHLTTLKVSRASSIISSQWECLSTSGRVTIARLCRLLICI